jgi:hypothetical protein
VTRQKHSFFGWGLLWGALFTPVVGRGFQAASDVWDHRDWTVPDTGDGALWVWSMLGLMALVFPVFMLWRWRASLSDFFLGSLGAALGLPVGLVIFGLYLLSNEHGWRV